MKGIYAIINLENGHFYIGSSANILKRLWNHLSCLRNDKEYFKNGQAILQKAWHKYGEDSFVFCAVEEYTGDDFRRDRNALEQKYLDFYWPTGLLYNVSPFASHPPPRVGPPPKGWKRSPESTQKAIETKRKNGTLARSSEVKEKLRIARLGKKQSAETVEKSKATRRANIAAGIDPQLKSYRAEHGLPPIKRPNTKKQSQAVIDKAKATYKKNKELGLHKDNSEAARLGLQKANSDPALIAKRVETFKRNKAAGKHKSHPKS